VEVQVQFDFRLRVDLAVPSSGQVDSRWPETVAVDHIDRLHKQKAQDPGRKHLSGGVGGR
jgi:hypothetical protein